MANEKIKTPQEIEEINKRVNEFLDLSNYPNVYKDALNLLEQTEVYLKNFHGQYSSLRDRLRNACLDMISSITLANAAYNNTNKRIEYLEDAFANFQKYKALLRVSFNLRQINSEGLVKLDSTLGPVGFQISGWLKSM